MVQQTICRFIIKFGQFDTKMNRLYYLCLLVQTNIYLLQRLFVKVSRQLRRLESASRSPIFSHFHETISGTSTIRAYQQQNRFISEISHRCDEVNTCHHILITSERYVYM